MKSKSKINQEGKMFKPFKNNNVDFKFFLIKNDVVIILNKDS
jgi:hypothetical protein